MISWLIIAIFVGGWVVAYPKVVRWAIRDLSRRTSINDKDRNFIAAWTVFASFFWPFLLVWTSLGKGLKKIVTTQEEKINLEEKK